MIKDERQKKLLEILQRDEFATVKALCDELEVSMPTVRRDLAELSKQNLLLRCHGGAMRVSDSQKVTPYEFRRSINSSKKASITRKAVKFIKPNSVIFIDSSTTTSYLLDHLVNVPDIIVITNSLLAAVHLKRLGIKTYCLGGEITNSSMAAGGEMAIEGSSYFSIDLMLFSSLGIDENGIIVDNSESETVLRQHLLKTCRESIFLCDSSKFERSSIYNVCSISDVDYVISDSTLPENFPKPKKETVTVKSRPPA